MAQSLHEYYDQQENQQQQTFQLRNSNSDHDLKELFLVVDKFQNTDALNAQNTNHSSLDCGDDYDTHSFASSMVETTPKAKDTNMRIQQ